MKTIGLAVLLLLSVGYSEPAHAAKPLEPSQAARELNAQSKKSLGVSVRALAFLFDADPGDVLTMNSVSLQRDWKYLKSLEKAGLVKLQMLGGGEYLQIVRTPKGEQVFRELYGP